jgi:hypothetical protein
VSKGNQSKSAATASQADHIDPAKVEAVGLDPARIQIHAERIGKALTGSITTTLPVLGACTVNNGGILPWKHAVRLAEGSTPGRSRAFLDSAQKYWHTRYLVTCIPAAGAASRYLAALRKFVLQFESMLTLVHNSVPASDQKVLQTIDGLPPLGPAERRTARSRLQLLEIPQELDQLAQSIRTLYPALETKIHDVIRELSMHVTSEHAIPPGVLGKSPADLSGMPSQAQMNMGIADQTLIDESFIRKHWETSGNSSLSGVPLAPQKIGTAAGHIHPLPAGPKDGEHVDFKSGPRSALRILKTARTTDHGTRSLNLEGSDGLILSEELNALEVYATCRILLDCYEAIPKALVPTTIESDDFLLLKLAEQMSLIPCSANVMICPAEMKQQFETEIGQHGHRLAHEMKNIFELARTPFCPDWLRTKSPKESSNERGEWQVLEQGNSLSTIRFGADGTPYETRSGNYSRVSGGHGELVHLFGDILASYPEAECLHIRNIDNIIGTGPERRREIQVPSRLFRLIRDGLEAIRAYLAGLSSDNMNSARYVGREGDARGAAASIARLALASQSLDWYRIARLDLPAAIARSLTSVFHWQNFPFHADYDEQVEVLNAFVSRPLSIFGVVRKETGDIGGGPVFSSLPDGQQIKLCMEMPHASAEDRELYFGARGKVTHFNPVLVFFELQTHKSLHASQPTAGKPTRQHTSNGRPVPFGSLFDDRFWLLAAKEFDGKKVCYHETVLYELIGNSARTNLIFVEVPRTLFNPHKSFIDGLGQDRKSYGFDETLKTQDERNS